ncbi:hypothetical protein F2P81_014054 [Scophthalmus maximus]|uniref:Fanconi anemia group C protein n=1 Tax=Scophthalmus maximus TaxID=52904 RepID=A0A6A4SPC4_SCOMX|nr:hypothetical protein F2P81_014054 [Scophthalmus maximus]
MTEEPSPNVQEIQFWLDKMVAWGRADSPNIQRDVSLHLRRLSSYLQQLLTHINNLFELDVCCFALDQQCLMPINFLTNRLRCFILNFKTTRMALGRALLTSLAETQAEGCSSSVCGDCTRSIRAMQWKEKPTSGYGYGLDILYPSNTYLKKVLCQLTTDEDDAAAEALMKPMGVPPNEYHLKVLRKMVALLQENIGKRCSSLGNINQRCSCDSILAASEACVPLATCPEAAPLIDALLQRPATCVRAALSEDFLDALSCAYSRQNLSLEEQAVFSLWHHSLSSLEVAVLSLLESVCTNTGSTPQRMLQQVSQSLLPKACAQQCSIFLVVNDIFRSTLKQAEGNECVKSLIQIFTNCFLTELALLQPQCHLSLTQQQDRKILQIPRSSLPVALSVVISSHPVGGTTECSRPGSCWSSVHTGCRYAAIIIVIMHKSCCRDRYMICYSVGAGGRGPVSSLVRRVRPINPSLFRVVQKPTG